MASFDFNFLGLLTKLAKDFLLPQVNATAGQYTPEQLHQLWNPVLAGSTEQLIPTSLGLINVTYGGKADGLPLVFWPSLMMRGSMYSKQYEHFAATNRVVLIDSPGINKSDPLRKYISLQDCVQVVIDVLDALHIGKCVFGGNSWGAMLASVLPAYHPERFHGTMSINGTSSPPSTFESALTTTYMETLMLNREVPDWWLHIARDAFSGDTADASRPEFLAYTQAVSQEDPKSIAWALRGILLGRTDTSRILKTIQDVSVLAVAGAGADDRQSSVETCRTLADAIPTSKFVVAKGVGHLAWREDPEQIDGMIEEFLRDIEVRGG